jgi:hypothetical protein
MYTCLVAVMGVGEWYVLYSYCLNDNKGPDGRFRQVALLTGLKAVVSVSIRDSVSVWVYTSIPLKHKYRGADKSLARPGRKQATATEDFDFHIFYL